MWRSSLWSISAIDRFLEEDVIENVVLCDMIGRFAGSDNFITILGIFMVCLKKKLLMSYKGTTKSPGMFYMALILLFSRSLFRDKYEDHNWQGQIEGLCAGAV